MVNDLLSLIREKKQLIAETQAELDEAMRELQAEAGAIVLPKIPPAQRPHNRRMIAGSPRRRRRRTDSSLAWSEAVLNEAGQNLHIDEMLKRIEQKFHQKVKKTTLVGNLARRVKVHDTFYRSAPNTFGLLALRKEKQLKVG